MAKFKVLSKVHCFGFKGRNYLPGELVEASEEDSAKFNLDYLERVPEPTVEEKAEFVFAKCMPDLKIVDVSPEVSVVDVAEAAALIGPEEKPEALVVHPKVAKNIRSKVLPKVPE